MINLLRRTLLLILVFVSAFATNPAALLPAASARNIAEPTPLAAPIREYRTSLDRLNAIALRLSKAANEQCANRWRIPGLSTHSRADYPRHLRKYLEDHIQDYPIIRHVRDTGLQDKLKPGDILLSPIDEPIADNSLELQALLALGEIRIQRGQSVDTIPIRRPLACYRPVRLTHDRQVLARTEINAIRISTGLVDFTQSDDELAYAIAHELSHFMLGHPQNLADAKESGRNSPSLNRQYEREADLGAIFLLNKAGFKPDAIVRFLRRTSRLRDIPLLGLSTHPTRASRIKFAEKALSMLSEAQSTQEDLTMADFVDYMALKQETEITSKPR